MDLKKELQKVNDKIAALYKMVEKLIVSADMPGKAKPKAAMERPAKKAVANKSGSRKPVVKKNTADKTLNKKPDVRKSVREKKSIANFSTGTAVDTVIGIIKESKNGINTAGLMGKTGFNEKKIQNLIFKLKKQGKVKNLDRGTYGIV